MTTKGKLITLFTFGVIAVALFFGYRMQQLKGQLQETQEQLVAERAIHASDSLQLKIHKLFLEGDSDSLLYYCENFGNLTGGKADFCGPLINLLLRMERQSEDLHLTKEELQLQARSLRMKIDSLEQSLALQTIGIISQQVQLDSTTLALTTSNDSIQRLLQSQEQHIFDTTSFVSALGYRVRYTGQMAKSKANGRGTGLWATGGYYHGQWKNNLRHGQGLYIWKEGHRYQGMFQNDARNGQGTYWWTNGERYEGNWKNNMRDGYGTLYGIDGVVKYQGQWLNDKPASKI